MGIIPAHAGLTDVTYVFWGRNGDHPRACGAHLTREMANTNVPGSSPRMRGSHTLADRAAGLSGIIPAHAGLTQLEEVIKELRRDHPRACGAHAMLSASGEKETGSSPRMRGSPVRQHVPHAARGIIPAHAGLTLEKQIH